MPDARVYNKRLQSVAFTSENIRVSAMNCVTDHDDQHQCQSQGLPEDTGLKPSSMHLAMTTDLCFPVSDSYSRRGSGMKELNSVLRHKWISGTQPETRPQAHTQGYGHRLTFTSVTDIATEPNCWCMLAIDSVPFTELIISFLSASPKSFSA